MMHETVKRLTNEDLAKVCGGQIYKVDGTDTFEGLTYKVEGGHRKKDHLYFVPNEIGFFIYGTEEEAHRHSPDFVNQDIIDCLTVEEAAEKAKKDAELYSVISVFPFI